MSKDAELREAVSLLIASTGYPMGMGCAPTNTKIDEIIDLVRSYGDNDSETARASWEEPPIGPGSGYKP